MTEIVIYVKDLKVTNDMVNESEYQDDIEFILDAVSGITEDTKATLTIKDGKSKVRIIIRDRHRYGKSNNVINHGASIKLLDPTEKIGKAGVPIFRDNRSGKIIADNPTIEKSNLSSVKLAKKVFEASEKRLNILWEKYDDDKKQAKLLKQIANDLKDAGIEVDSFVVDDNKELTDNLNNRVRGKK